MEYSKNTTGAWFKADEVKSGTKAKIITECVKQESQFKDADGTPKTENIAKVRFQGAEEAVNMRLNWTTIYGLIDAYGKDSKDWIGKVLTLQTREMVVGDTVRDVAYLIPEGFELVKNEERKLEIRKIAETQADKDPETGETDINPDDIPF